MINVDYVNKRWIGKVVEGLTMEHFLLLLSVFVLASAQQPTPCESPKQWEARYFSYERGSLLEEGGSITYDETEERVRFLVREEANGTLFDAFEVIELYLKGVEYRYDYITQQCTQREIDRPFRPIGVPPNATSYGQLYIGTSGDPEAGLLVDIFGGEFGEGERYEITVTAGACIPVNDILVTRVGDRFEERVIDFYDVVAPFSDPDVFIPPSACL